MVENYQYNVDKMYTYLRGYLVGANLQQSLTALQFARDKHKDQTRKNGVPYIVHPLSMACYAIALGIKNDNIISTIILHDVPEDCNVEVENLPVNDTVKLAVKCMTVQKLKTDKSKIETKRRYFYGLLESKEAVICKALDRYNNLSEDGKELIKAIVDKIVEEAKELQESYNNGSVSLEELVDLLEIIDKLKHEMPWADFEIDKAKKDKANKKENLI